MLQESDIVPYHLSPPPGERVLILAPHPDDEAFGCGGAIRLLVNAHKTVKVIFLTSGDKAEPMHPLSSKSVDAHITAYALLREKEATKALGVLGVSAHEFLRFPDREVHAFSRGVRERLMTIMEAYGPDTIYAPSMTELNPDHRATAALAVELQGSMMSGSRPSPLRIVFYEVTTPLRPNVLVDISGVYGRKKKAIQRYRSQLRVMDYLGHITALNKVRALTVKGARYVEAFWCAERPLSSEEAAKWLSYQLPLSD